MFGVQMFGVHILGLRCPQGSDVQGLNVWGSDVWGSDARGLNVWGSDGPLYKNFNQAAWAPAGICSSERIVTGGMNSLGTNERHFNRCRQQIWRAGWQGPN